MESNYRGKAETPPNKLTSSDMRNLNYVYRGIRMIQEVLKTEEGKVRIGSKIYSNNKGICDLDFGERFRSAFPNGINREVEVYTLYLLELEQKYDCKLICDVGIEDIIRSFDRGLFAIALYGDKLVTKINGKQKGYEKLLNCNNLYHMFRSTETAKKWRSSIKATHRAFSKNYKTT